MPRVRRLLRAALGRSRPVIFLHIGAMKTGTTFLQHLMHTNRESLLAAGYLIPGDRTEQGRATRDILGTADKTPERQAQCEGVWDELSARMMAHKGDASIFSMEFLSFADGDQAARVVSSLEGAEVHVILTVRDATSALPSQWQTSSRNGGTAAWPRFVGSVRRGVRGKGPPRGQGARTFLRAQGIPRMLDAWGSAVPPGRFHVITVPRSRSDPMLLWKRFASVVGVDPAVCSIGTQRSNPSLGQPSAELIRRINVRMGKLPGSEYSPTLKAELASRILTVRAPLEYSPQLDRRTRRFALRWNHRVRRAIRASGAHLVGELADLPHRLPEEIVRSLPTRLVTPPDEELLAPAATARDGLVALIRRRELHLEVAGVPETPAALDDKGLPTTTGRWDAAADPVDAAIDELISLLRVAIELYKKVDAAPRLPPEVAERMAWEKAEASLTR